MNDSAPRVAEQPSLPSNTVVEALLPGGARLLRHRILPIVVVERDGAWFSAFSPQSPSLLPPTYIAPLAEIAYTAHTVCGGTTLHLGGAGMAAARAMAALGAPSAVVDIDEELCSALLELYPVPDIVDVIYGDARDHAGVLAPRCPQTIIDVGCGVFDDENVALVAGLVEQVIAARDSAVDTTVAVNLHLARDEHAEAKVSKVSDALSVLGPVARFDGGLAAGPVCPQGNTLLMSSENPVMRRVLSECEWAGWPRVDIAARCSVE